MLRLIKLYPNQVAAHWERLWPCIEAALPPIVDSRKSEVRMNNVFKSILAGKLVVHIFCELVDGETKIYGVLTTAIYNPVDSEDKELLIYSMFADVRLSRELLEEGFELIKKYALSEDCRAVNAYTKVNGFRKFIEMKGGDASFTFIRLEV